MYRRKCRVHNRLYMLLMILLERVIHDRLKETLYIERKSKCIKDVRPEREKKNPQGFWCV